MCIQQETATHKQSLSKTRESQLEAKIEMLEATKSDLEKEMEKPQKQVMELEKNQSSDIGLLKEVLSCISQYYINLI